MGSARGKGGATAASEQKGKPRPLLAVGSRAGYALCPGLGFLACEIKDCGFPVDSGERAEKEPKVAFLLIRWRCLGLHSKHTGRGAWGGDWHFGCCGSVGASFPRPR